MLFDITCYALAILAVLFVMAPQVHADSYTGKPSAIEIEATVIAETTEDDQDEWVTLVWPHDEDEDSIEWEYSTCECQWVDEVELIEDPWLSNDVILVLPTLVRQEEACEEPVKVLLLTAAQDVKFLVPTHTKGFTPTKSSPTKRKKGAKKK